jgi:hypothetical protein
MIKVNKFIERIGKKAVVLVIAAIFIVGVFNPAFGSQFTIDTEGQPEQKNKIKNTDEISNNNYNSIDINSEYVISENQTSTSDIQSEKFKIVQEALPSEIRDFSSDYFNWSTTNDWKNGTASQIYIRNGVLGIGGYDDFEEYPTGSLPPEWEERITENIWLIKNNNGDNCLYHTDGSEHLNLYSEVLTTQWGNLSNFTLQAKYVGCGSNSNTYLVGRVDYDTNTQMSDRNGYGCRNAQPQNQRTIFEWYDGNWNVLTSDSDDISGDMYEKLMIVGGDSDPDLYAKFWSALNSEPTSWHHTYTGGTNFDSLSGVPGMGSWSDSGAYYISDLWLTGGWHNGTHTTEWKDAIQSIYLSVLCYNAANISSGNQDILITVEVSDDAITIADSISFYAENGYNIVDISSLQPAQYLRISTCFSTLNETKTPEISSYSVEYQTTPVAIRISNPYPSNSNNVVLAPHAYADVNSTFGYLMNITWKYYDTDHWYIIGTNNSVNNGTYFQILENASNYNTQYLWGVEVSDGHGNWSNKTYYFRTFTQAPVILNINPPDVATEIPISLSKLNFTLIDYENDLMNYTVSSSPDITAGMHSGVNILNGTVIEIPIFDSPLDNSTTYNWWVNVTDGKEWTNETFVFTTVLPPPEFSIKWHKNIGSGLSMQGATADLNGDGIKDFVYPIGGGLRAVNGVDGTIMWSRSISGSSGWSQVEVNDLNNDGIPECVTPVWSGALVAVHGNNGSIYWRTTLYGSDGAFAHPLILDYDNDGYPHIFEGDRGSNAKIYKIRHDGVIEATKPITHLCAGGVTGGDYDNDGHFEIYFGDDDGAPQNMESYWAENLTLRWRRNYYLNTSYKYLASAGCPALVDCNNDGLKDVVVAIGLLSGPEATGTTGFAVLSAKDGTIIKNVNPLSGMAEHRYLNFQEVYDIDRDGNPEYITSTNHVIAYDLIENTMDLYASASSSRWPPLIAEVTGDGQIDLVVAMGSYLRVYDNDYNIVARIPETGYLPGSGSIIHPVAADVDNDGFNEIVLARTSGEIVVIDTVAPANYGGSRAGEKGYSICRQGVAEYVSILALKNEQPRKGATGVMYNPNLNVNVFNLQGEMMNILFKTNVSGTWETIGDYTNVCDGTYSMITTNMYDPLTRYWWSVNATDRKNTWANMTYSFTTGDFIPIAPVISNISPPDQSVGVPISLYSIGFDLLDHQGDMMDYNIVTNPDVGDDSAFGVINGSYNVLIDALLEYNTTYVWYLNITDGKYWKNNTYSFTTETSEPALLNEKPESNAILININPLLQVDILDWQNDTVNWWIRTNSSGIWATLNNGTVVNGTGRVSTNTSNMNLYETKYWWSVNVTDLSGSGNWTNRTYTFMTSPEPSIHELTVDHTIHMNYGLSYPVTYIFNISQLTSDLKAYKYDSSWVNIPTRNSTDTYSGVESARFDYDNGTAYISVSFPIYQDSMYIKVTNMTGTLVYTEYMGIAKYYDNRKAAFVLTADDWCETQDASFKAAIDACQARNIWITPAIVTHGVAKYPEWHYPPDWSLVQNETAEGFVEPASHSCHHLNCTSSSNYNDYQWGVQSSYDNEIGGSKQYILENLTMPSLNTRGDQEYLYAWVEPFGHWSSTVSQKLGEYYYLGDRSTGSGTGFASWSSSYGTYNRVGVAVSGDGKSASSMNSVFNSVYNSGGIHHIYLHPRNHNWVSGPVVQHLDYVANRSDVWYVGFGHLYAYHYMADQDVISHSTFTGNLPPVVSLESPENGSVGIIPGSIQLEVTIQDVGDMMNLTFMTNASGSWQVIGSNLSVGNGRYEQMYTFADYDRMYYWRVHCGDGTGWTNETYDFSTRPENYLPVLTNPFPTSGTTSVNIGEISLSITVNDRDNDSMNITFLTNASGSWSMIGTNNSQQNGTYTQSYSFDEYETCYWWRVTCFDDKGWTNETYSLTTREAPITDPFNQGWQYRREIIIDHDLVAGNLTGFPVLISISDDTDLSSHAQSDGDDLLFMDNVGDAYQLPHEIEFFNGTDLICWVNVSSLSSTQDTIFYMYYGNPTVGNCQDVEHVWDYDYMLVQHLNETSGIHYDSSGCNNDGSPMGGINQNAIGVIDGTDDFDGSNDYIDCGTNGSLDITNSITVSAWARIDIDEHGRLVSKHGGGSYGWAVIRHDGYLEWALSTDGSDWNQGHTSSGSFPVGSWVYVTATFDGEYMRAYMDGVEDTGGNMPLDLYGTINVAPASTQIGRDGYSGDSNCFDGLLDEIRISKNIRNADWIWTEYHNQHDPLLFASVGSETSASRYSVSYPSPVNGAVDQSLSPVLSVQVNDSLGDLMNVTFLTNASSSIWHVISSNVSVLNGTYYCDNTGEFDSMNTRYWWQVNVSGPIDSTEQLFYFTTRSDQIIDPFNQGWQYRREIIINHSMVAGNLSGFPVMIRIQGDSDLENHTQSDGDDILFMDGPDVADQLPHEIEFFNGTDLVCWVNISILSSTQDTVLYMYYGNPSSENCENVADVWDSGFVGVWHMNETSGSTVYDSSRYSNDGTSNGVNLDSLGIADGGDDFTRVSNTVGDFVDCNNDASLNPTDALTIETWVNFDDVSSAAGRQSLIGKYYENYEMSLLFDKDPTQYSFYKYGDNTGHGYDEVLCTLNSSEINAGNWHYFASGMSGTSMVLYFDGQVKNTTSGTYSGTVGNSDDLNIGRRVRLNTQYVDGVMDEVRVSSVLRNASWIETEYNNLLNFSLFCDVGDEEEAGIGVYYCSVPLGEEWNLVSLPVNQSVHKNNITVNYLDVNYTWQDAVTAGILLNFVYSWDAVGQGYLTTDVLVPGEGNWIYAYSDCVLWISSNISNDDSFIADLFVNWNLVGIPFDEIVEKQNLTVVYGGMDYSWQDAVTAGFVLNFVYSWDAVGQSYLTTDVLMPGDGYWVYAYYSCKLKKEEI